MWHAGDEIKKASGETVDMVINNMSVLTGSSKDELYGFVDFWINDRAGDNIVKLGVKTEKRLYCNVHVLLTIDEAIDSAFRTTEIKTGKASH